MAAAKHLLIVEDHDDLRATLRDMLAPQGYCVAAFSCVEDVTDCPDTHHYDLAILDLNLPGEDGLSFARRLRRAQPDIGIIMLTGRGALEDRLAGYESGADLYLAKPIAIAELQAQLRALARRIPAHLPTAAPPALPRLDRAGARLYLPAGPLELREQEAALLHALALAPERQLESWQLLQILDKLNDARGKAQLEVLVSRLRIKLEQHGLPARPIISLRGYGYRLGFEMDLM